MNRIDGKVCMVTGPTSGIGREVPEVILCDRGSMKQLAQAARKFLDLDLLLHNLVNNAGLLNQR